MGNTNSMFDFPEYDSPWGKDSFFLNTSIKDENDDEITDNDTHVITRGFEQIEQMLRFFAGQSDDAYGTRIDTLLNRHRFTVVCAYVYLGDSKDNGIVIRISQQEAGRLAALSKSDLDATLDHYADQINIFSKGKENDNKNDYKYFHFSVPQITKALKKAVPLGLDKLKSIKKFSKETEKLFNSNYKYFLDRLQYQNDPEAEQAIKRLCALLAEVDYDVVETYNQNPLVRNDTYDFERSGDKLTKEDIFSMINHIEKISDSIKYFHTNRFNNTSEILAYVNKNYGDASGIGAETRFVINFPFKNLAYAQRKEMLQMFIHNDRFEFNGFWEGAHFDGQHTILAGDIVYNLWVTASQAERVKLVQELDNEEKELFYMLDHSSGECFQALSFIVGSTILASVNSSEKKYTEAYVSAMENQNYFFFDDYGSKAQNHKYDEEKKMIFLENRGHLFDYPENDDDFGDRNTEAHRNFEKENAAAEAQFYYNEQKYLASYASPKKYFSPADLVIFTAESDLNSDILNALFSGDAEFKGMKKDDMLLLPACLVYLVFKEYNEKKSVYNRLVVLSLVFLPFGVVGLLAAIQAAALTGIIVELTGVALDVAVLAVNDPQAIENNKNRAKFINTLAFFYVLARLPGVIEGTANFAKGANRLLIKALEQLKRSGKILFSGSGGVLKYLKVFSSRNVFKQEERMSCAAACIRQLAKDNDIILEESYVREIAKTSELGTSPQNMAEAMISIFGKEKLEIGMKYTEGISDAVMATNVSNDGVWIAWTKKEVTDKIAHCVIVDKIVGNKVYIRDPWPLEGFEKGVSGAEAIMDLHQFSDAWKKGYNFMFKVKK